MGRAIFSLTAIGAGLVVGGVAYAAAMGYDVSRVDIWFKGVRVVAQTPGVAIEFATNGSSESPFYQALLMGTTGLTCLFGAAAWASIRTAIGTGRGTRAGGDATDTVRHKMKQKALGDERGRDAFSDEDMGAASAKSGGLSTMAKIAQALDKRKAEKEFDATLDEEDGGKKNGQKTDKAGGALLSMLGRKPALAAPSSPKENWDAPVDEAPALPAPEEKHQQARPARITKATARVRVDAEGGWQEKIARIQDTLQEGWARVLSLLDKKKTDAVVGQDIDGSSTASAQRKGMAHLDAEILEWFRSVQQSTGNTHDKVSAAARYAKLLSEEERVAFVERNSIDGAFILRLIDSWSTRTDRDTAPANEGEANEERAALRAAIRAVHLEKAGKLTIDEGTLPEEFKADMEAEETRIEREEEAGFEDDVAGVETPQGGEDDPAGFGKTSVGGATATTMDEAEDEAERAWTTVEKEIVSIAQKMRDFVITLREVQAFEASWEDDLADTDMRQDYIDEIDSRFAQLAFMMEEEDLERLMEREGAEPLHWALSLTDIREKGFAAYVEGLMEEDVGAGMGGDVDTTGNGPQDSADNGWSDDDIVDTPPSQTYEEDVDLADEDTPEKSVEAETDGMTSEDVDDTTGASFDAPGDDADADAAAGLGEESGAEEGAEGSPEAATSDAPEEENAPSAYVEEGHEDEAVPPALEGAEGAEEASQEGQGADQESASVDGPHHGRDEANTPLEQEEAPSPMQEEEAEKPHEPVDIGWADMQEIAASSEFIKQWGVSSKRAGATNGAMMKFTSRRDGDNLVPLGLIHLVMLWKDRANIGRVNLMFRHLDEGEWRMDPERVGRFVRANGDTTEIAPSLFESDDFQKALLIIHLHGPGVAGLEGPVPDEWGDKTWVVDEVATGEEILARLDAATP